VAGIKAVSKNSNKRAAKKKRLSDTVERECQSEAKEVSGDGSFSSQLRSCPFLQKEYSPINNKEEFNRKKKGPSERENVLRERNYADRKKY